MNKRWDKQLPIVRELPQSWTPQICMDRLLHLPHPLLMESALKRRELGRYSFLGVDPAQWFEDRGEPSDTAPPNAWLPLPQNWSDWVCEAHPELPPFQGGLAGWMSYELSGRFEELPQARYRPFALPLQAWGLYDLVLAWDHHVNRGWLISQGLPEIEFSKRLNRANERAQMIWELLADESVSATSDTASRLEIFSSAALEFAPQFEIPQVAMVTSNFSRSLYLEAVERARDYIAAGDIFQVNLSHQLIAPQTCNNWQLYRRLSQANPATFAGYFDLGDSQIVSASPERLLRSQNGQLETRPIKGTRARTGIQTLDEARTAELLANRKDLAENVMIVDLMRNDLSRVCVDDSVVVTQLCQPENYETVIHLVSAVTGQLRPEVTPSEWLAAVFPGGSVTGAPKIRSMEIITELEQSARGAYCGSLGYLSITGQADFNLLIRTITGHGGWWQFPVGGAIVYHSDPAEEWDETWTKAQGLLRAIQVQRRESTIWR